MNYIHSLAILNSLFRPQSAPYLFKMKFLAQLLIVGAAVAAPAPQAKAPTACDAATAAQVSQLSQGIQSNLAIQAQELAGYGSPPPPTPLAS